MINENGITVKSYDEIRRDLERKMKTRFGETFDTTPESPDGMMISLMAEFISDMWVLAESAYHSYNPAVATGIGLDNLVRLNGIRRIVNEPTKVGVQFNATTSVGEAVPAGTTVATADGLEFLTQTEVVVPGETLATCTTPGAIVVVANEVNIIKSNLPSDITVNNEDAGITGIVREEDPELRARRERTIIRTGTSTSEAIYSAVADLNLEFIAVIENDTDATVDGVPPHSFHTVADGSSIELIAERIYNKKPTGIQAFGNVITTIYDSKGHPHEIGVSRPTAVPIWVRCSVVRGENVAITGARDIRNALFLHINTLQISEDVIWANLFAPATQAAPEIIVKSIEISLDGITWTTADHPIAVIERAVTDLEKVTVVELEV